MRNTVDKRRSVMKTLAAFCSSENGARIDEHDRHIACLSARSLVRHLGAFVDDSFIIAMLITITTTIRIITHVVREFCLKKNSRGKEVGIYFITQSYVGWYRYAYLLFNQNEQILLINHFE